MIIVLFLLNRGHTYFHGIPGFQSLSDQEVHPWKFTATKSYYFFFLKALLCHFYYQLFYRENLNILKRFIEVKYVHFANIMCTLFLDILVTFCALIQFLQSFCCDFVSWLLHPVLHFMLFLQRKYEHFTVI